MDFEGTVREFQLLALEAHARRAWDRPAAERLLRTLAAHVASAPHGRRLEEAYRKFRVAPSPGRVFLGTHDGRIVPCEGGFRVEFAPWLDGDARDFVLLHECAHTLFYSRDPTPVRLVPPGDPLEEELCDAFAQAVLAPLAIA